VPEPIGSGESLERAGAASERMAVTRYRLRAAAHRMAADCERMLGGLDRPERRLWRESVGEALIASRHLLALVEHPVPPGEPADPTEYFAQLHGRILEPQLRVIEAMNTLLRLVPTGAEEELMMEDARVVRETAVEFWALDDTVQAAASGAGGGLLSRAAASPEPDRQKPRLLVVDDDPGARRALTRLLGRLGYEVIVAEHGRAALEIADRQALDLILTDIAMPELDGFELLRRLKASDRTREVPVIVVSGIDDLQSVAQCIEQGAEDHVTKPFEAILLQARVRACLERKRMRDLELAYLRRVGQLSAAAEAVEREAYEPGSLDTVASHDDELGRLARVFDRMVLGMRSREDRLQRRLAHLRHEMRQVRGRASGEAVTITGESPFASGQLVGGRYEILGELGKGGMGMVYHARDRELGEEIAMKVVRRDVVEQNPSLVERLKLEIRLARRITHRNVVRTHDLGEWEGVYFLTMEYVKGISVEELLNTRGALTVESTLAIGSQLAEALAVAHEQQIVHRDIKPANLLVDAEGCLKVMDFGLARVAERSSPLTLAGFVVGTPGYVAPEVHLGAAADARSDLFSAGVVLYECLTGLPPFDASSPMAVVDRVLEARPRPIREIVPRVPPALAALIERLLKREPQDRPGSARELAEQLGEIGQPRP
jgi:DNA-binding response OmpR family regulator